MSDNYEKTSLTKEEQNRENCKIALQEECANCERWEILRKGECAQLCEVFQSLDGKKEKGYNRKKGIIEKIVAIFAGKWK